MGFLLDVSPADLGFKEPFNEYRLIQNEAIDFAVESFTEDEVGVVGLSCPTGSGKTLTGASIAQAMGLRTAFVTAFKGLEAQYQQFFGQYGMVDIQGRSNYPCVQFGHLDCRGGSSIGCSHVKTGGCSYGQAKSVAKEARWVVTNYAYWMNVNDKANGLERNEKEAEFEGENPIELLILDEGHMSGALLASYVSCQLSETDAKLFGGYPMNETLAEWTQWAKQNIPVLLLEIRNKEIELAGHGKKVTPAQVKVLHHYQVLQTTLNKIAFASPEDWIVEMEVGTKQGRVWKFDCIWPGKYARHYLFCNVPKVIVMSATLKEKKLWDLGVGRDDYRYKAWRRIFSGNRHPIYQVTAKKPNGAGIGISRKTSERDMELVIEFADREIIKPRLDRKGLIQTVSYDLQKRIFQHSDYSHLFIGNTNDPSSDSAQEAAEEFRKAKPPSLLVSPSFSAGWDFPGSEVEYIILFKVPFMPAVSKIVQARLKKDPQYINYATMQIIEQSVGRGMRFELDRCEVFLLDRNFAWFLMQNRGLAQDWFVQAVRSVAKVPGVPEKLK